MSSFFCERTAEYALVPRLQRSLEAHFGSAIPIFYWKTREGNRVSSEVHRAQFVQVLAMFARRPKLTGRKDWLSGKINFEIFQFADAARSVGVPTIAGFPAVASLHGLYSDPPIYWLPIEKSNGVISNSLRIFQGHVQYQQTRKATHSQHCLLKR